ncbi:MAG: BMP family ABC transporter substrate-binding protein [Rhodobacteraceae bacterium]|nr:BMP family ABC transporter substrate-binding protein [Paracoccaceae bacterium]
MTPKRTSIFLAAALGLGLAGPVAADEPLKIGFVYSSLIGDAGWTFQHDLGRLMLEEEFGDRVETAYVESIDGGADAERVIRQFASQDFGLIFGTSFNHMNPMARVAAQFPDIAFEHATGYTQDTNLAIYHTRAYESRYLVGMVAGLMGDSLGVVASYPIPEVLRGINAMTLGARSVNPDFTTRVVWISSWFDPGLERTAADALLDQGVDVLAHFTDSPAVVQAAEDRGKYVVALGDMAQYGENSHLTALVYNWGPYYVERTRMVLDGTWETANTWEGISADMMTIAPYNDAVPQDVRDVVDAKMEEIRSGAFHPFQGPLVAQDGSEKVADGELPDDGLLLSMDFYVEGIEGSLP